MAIHAVDKTFTQFLSPQENIIYKIPAYQREYSWKTDNCETLLNDIKENDSGYFIGSIIWISSTKEIIDGQQRLTTLSLLLTAIYERLNSSSEDISYRKNSLKRMIVFAGENRLVPQNQGRNKDDYEYLIKNKITMQPCAAPRYYGNRRIYQNYNTFVSCISDFTDEELCTLYDKICSLSFISAEVDDVQTAFVLFETMNNRGMALSPVDLIKSTYMAQTDNENSITDWENLVSILGNEKNQEQFLRNNYNAFRKEYNNIEMVDDNTVYHIASKATHTNVIKIYNSLIQRKDFIDFLTINAKFNSLLTGEDNPQVDTCNNFKTYFTKFRNSKSTSAFILLLFLLRNQTPFNLTDEEMCQIFEKVLRFQVRRNLTNTPSTGALPQIQMEIIAKINSLHNPNFLSIIDCISSTLRSKLSSDNDLKERLQGDIYDSNKDMTRYLLCSLCADEGSNERRLIDLWEKKNEKYIWTIEHILPEGNKDASNTPIHWIEMIRNGDSKYSKYSNDEIIEQVKLYRHKLGNLTMTGYNSSLGNKSFDEKKNRIDSNNNPIGYNNGLSLNTYVFSQCSGPH